MFDSSKFLLILGADPEKWAARYAIEPVGYPCGRCGTVLTTTIPFACGQFRGLIAPQCACGNEESPLYCFVRDPRYGDLFTVDRAVQGPRVRAARRTSRPAYRKLSLVGTSGE
jgi:hypothetical protein